MSALVVNITLAIFNGFAGYFNLESGNFVVASFQFWASGISTGLAIALMFLRTKRSREK